MKSGHTQGCGMKLDALKAALVSGGLDVRITHDSKITFGGKTFQHKKALCSVGCKWDGNEKVWWCKLTDGLEKAIKGARKAAAATVKEEATSEARVFDDVAASIMQGVEHRTEALQRHLWRKGVSFVPR